MAFKVDITDSAKAELDEIVRYFVEDEEDKKVVTIMHVFYAKRDYDKLV